MAAAGATIGRSILSAATRTRVATRSAGKVGLGVGGGGVASGGSVSRGVALGPPAMTDGAGDSSGPASTGLP